ncbi:transglutaminase-like domain-containing protein [Frankia sp. AgPm24]|uniref:transglutaminase-like domain-containing protein n=1 Tax=Frankia sp. AgPm24 TaxID=631128 RepID=UPI00200D21FB|nr:transglutaminase-like domain-containing protein [Frankia sp. AgPm24]MCK9924406.1 transglutaminase-like domain-containing protein [Frankia sp. AgPm24]
MPARSRSGRSWQLAQAALLLTVALAVAGEFAALFAGWTAWPVLAGAVLASAAATGAARRLSTRMDVRVVVSLAGLATFLVVAVFGWADGRAVGGPRAALSGLRRGWSSLLAAGLPTDPRPSLLAVPVLLLWLATALAVTLATRSDTTLAPLAPLVLAFAVAASLLTLSDHPPLATSTVLALAGLGFGLARGARRGDDAAPGLGAGAVLLGAPVVVVAVLAGITLTAVAPGSGRFDPRTVHPQPVLAVAQLDPLAQVRPQLSAAPPRALGTIRLASSNGRLPVDRVLTAVLGDFDGASWRNLDPYLPVGHTLPSDPDQKRSGQVATGTITVRGDVTLDHLDTALLPVAGQPSRLRGTPTAFDARTGTLISTAPGGARGARYRFTAAVADMSPDRLADAVAGTGPSLARYRTVPPGAPPQLAMVAARATAGAATPYAQLTALQRYLRDPTRFPYDLAGRPGHSYGALTRLLTSEDPRERHSYAEQHAAAFALLARLRGFPTRIAVGYLLGPRTPGRPGVYTISQARAHAWPEVYLAGFGWVTFEPTDTSHLALELPPDAAGQGTGRTGNPPPTAAAASGRTTAPLSALPTLDQRDADGQMSARHVVVVVLLAVLLVLGVLGPLAVVAEKARRRRRRCRTGPPGQRVAAAWREARDRLSEWGVSPAATRSVEEVLRDAAVLGSAVTEPLLRLAPLVSQALYDRGEPADGDAAQAWELVVLLRQRIAAAVWWPRRLRAALDPRPVLRSGRPGPGGHPGRQGAGGRAIVTAGRSDG